jgi:hypothetical protein
MKFSMERAYRPVFTLLTALLLSLIVAGCGGREDDREYPAQGSQNIGASSPEATDLRATYCNLIKMLYGPETECMDGGRAFLDEKREVVAGVVYDGDYHQDVPSRRYLICLRESTLENDELSILDALVVEWTGKIWKKTAEMKEFMKVPLLESVTTASAVGSPVVKIGYIDTDQKTKFKFFDFREGKNTLLDSFQVPNSPFAISTCLGGISEADLSRHQIPNSKSTDFLMTPFERLIAENFTLDSEDKMPVPVPEDSIVRRYHKDNIDVTVIELVEPNGETIWCRIDGPLCKDGLPGLFRLLQALYPRLRPFDLNLNGVFGVVRDHEDFQVTRINGDIIRIVYDSFRNGQQAHIELKTDRDVHLLDFRFYHL